MAGELPMVGGPSQLPQVSRPVLLVVDPTPALACGLEQDLRREFTGQGYEAFCVDSGPAALAAIAELKEQRQQLALLVVSQDMTPTSGLELIEQARGTFREARTVLLIDHKAMPAALDALNAGTLDHFLVKPLAASEEQLCPIVADLLSDWEWTVRHEAKAVRVVDRAHTEESHQLREFLRRNDFHYRFVDVDRDNEAQLLLQGAVDTTQLPLVVLGDGSRLEAPTPLALAEALGLPTRPRQSVYDLVIVGGGPAGLAAAVYGASEGLSTVLVEREAPGGQAGQSSRIENYLGFPRGLSGSDLAQRALRQARRFDAELVRPTEAVALEVGDRECVVRLLDGSEIRSPTAMLACGVTYRRLGAAGVAELLGRGVYYGAAMTEAREAEGEHVFVVGGANSAGQAALHFSQYARQVTIVVRAGSLAAGMSHYLVERIAGADNIEVLTRTRVVGVAGQTRLETIDLEDLDAGNVRTTPSHWLFIFIGAVPHTDWLADAVSCDERGFVLSGRDLIPDGRRPAGWTLDRDPFPLETSVPGVFVAGDMRHGSIKRVASAVGEGSMAVQLIHQYLGEQT